MFSFCNQAGSSRVLCATSAFLSSYNIHSTTIKTATLGFMSWISEPRLFLEQESSQFGHLFVPERIPQLTPVEFKDGQTTTE